MNRMCSIESNTAHPQRASGEREQCDLLWNDRIQVHDQFMPWLFGQVNLHLDDRDLSRSLVNNLISSALEKAKKMHREVKWMSPEGDIDLILRMRSLTQPTAISRQEYSVKSDDMSAVEVAIATTSWMDPTHERSVNRSDCRINWKTRITRNCIVESMSEERR
ncbi:hypothetical protein PROFUN_15313 [Planoprotostelium fungivorum]|uniref:Uncharacterized protein n=1 Tax=Planoprotostelium fungivorum TaxID=1890364 RepID=A0A2P6MX01_9EUKA|nr:hypothetical protein PROFUN_15313 [Planoprotostelium fungivorum]